MLLVAVDQIDEAAGAGDLPMPGWCSGSERARWASLPPGARAGFAASRALLRRLLQTVCGVGARPWDISAEPGTAPVVRDTAALRASLSHRLGWVAAAVSDGAVGVDVEVARPSRSDPDERAALMLAPEELPAWHALARTERESALLTRWTAKEAWFKASAAQDVAWDFRRVVARACAPALANVRTWAAAPLHVAVCCDDPDDLAAAHCQGLAESDGAGLFWHVALA